MFFSNETEVFRLASEFYGAKLPFSKWNKAAQLTVTLYYAIRFPYRMAFELIRDRVSIISPRRYSTAEQRIDLEANIHTWLSTARMFARRYQNIDDLSALANIFISTNWRADDPYPDDIDHAIYDAVTARLDGAAVGISV